MAKGRTGVNYQRTTPQAGANRAGMMLMGNPEDMNNEQEPEYDSIPVLEAQNPMGEPEADPSLVAVEPQNDESPVAQVEQQSTHPPEPATDNQIPEKFKNAKPEDVAKSYVELEKELGRLRNENGDYRKTFDKLILERSQPKEYPKVDPAQVERENAELLNLMLQNPRQFVQDLRQQTIGEFQGMLRQQGINQAIQSKAHILGDPNFRNWVANNVPMETAIQADQNPAALDFVIKQFQRESPAPAAAPTPTQPMRPPNIQVKPAGVAAGTSPTSRAVSGEKIWTRSEIRRIMQYPDKYAEMEPEIRRAYNMGMVRD